MRVDPKSLVSTKVKGEQKELSCMRGEDCEERRNKDGEMGGNKKQGET